MISNFKKLVTNIKTRGFVSTAKKISDKLQFESRCRITAMNLGLRRSFTKNALVIRHGKYKFNFYGGGDRGEILYHAFWDKMFLEDTKKIKNYVKTGDIVIDVGGNLGLLYLLF